MKLVGYTDRLSVQPGQTIRFMVSAEAPSYEARITRLIHGDPNPLGPGAKQEPLDAAANGVYRGRQQPFYRGSYVLIPDGPALAMAGSFSLQAWIYPTTPGKGTQGIVSRWSATEEVGYGLFLDEDGSLALWLGAGPGRIVRLRTGVPLLPRTWYRVAATYDAAGGDAWLVQEPATRWPADVGAATHHRGIAVRPGDARVPLVMAGCVERVDGGRARIGGHFNGKIDAPVLLRGALSQNELAALARRAPLEGLHEATVAAWDFSRCISSTAIHDAGPLGLHGATENMPMRGVTGHNWTGRETDFRLAPQEYGAIHFHDDDLDDAGWEVDFAWEVPEGLHSGVYAAHLRAGEAEDFVPFFVRPRRGMATAPLAVLLPTLSYLAYGNEHITWRNAASPVSHDVRAFLQPEDYYADAHQLLSLYDHHSDGSGTCYASRLRPLLNMRPGYHMALLRGPHQFPADLQLLDWLEAKGHRYDVITDEDLHEDGSALLQPYRALITGSHPEYWTGQMLDALRTYRDAGGRLMYLGGNGFYWVTSIDPAAPHRIEIRRGHSGTGTWRSAPGETHHSTTGEPGGLWRHRGRAPQGLVGVGMTTQGFDVALPYRRREGSNDPRAAFIVVGIGPDEPIGDAGLVMGGAAGLELDRADHDLGTPRHALVVATATGFSDSYQHVVEEIEASDSRQGGSVEPRVRADVVYFETPGGGGVFSVGSITWCACLSHRGYDNPVSRMTENVVRRFLGEGGGAAEMPDSQRET